MEGDIEQQKDLSSSEAVFSSESAGKLKFGEDTYPTHRLTDVIHDLCRKYSTIMYMHMCTNIGVSV